MTFKDFLQLIRYKNLIIVFVTQFLVWKFLLLGLPIEEHHFFLNGTHFGLLSLTTVLIAAAGYVINDYFDIGNDVINRPNKALVNKSVNMRYAIKLHNILNVIAIFIAGYLCKLVGNYALLSIQVICTVLLWFYSTHFKRQFVIGNFIVALLTASSILIIPIYERLSWPYFIEGFFISGMDENMIVNPMMILFVYACFAFMLTWMREVVKDMEDYKGDAMDGCVTMPIKIGLKKSGEFVQILGVITIIPLIMGMIKLIDRHLIFSIYIGIGLLLPIVWLMVKINKNTTVSHYAYLSKVLKFIMVLGILILLFYKYI